MGENSKIGTLDLDSFELDKHPLIRDALKFAYASFDTLRLRLVRETSDGVEEERALGLRNLEEELGNGMNVEKFMQCRRNNDAHCDAQIAEGRERAFAEADRQFIQKCMMPALEVTFHSDKPTPERVAAALLAPTVQSALDYERLRQAFAETPAVPRLVATLHDFKAYPNECNDRLREDKTGAKSLYMAFMVSSMGHLLAAADRLQEDGPANDNKIPMLNGEAVFAVAQAAWDGDAKMQQRFKHVFNLTANVTDSGHLLETLDNGAPRLVTDTLPGLSLRNRHAHGTRVIN